LSDKQFKPGDLVVWDADGPIVESIVLAYDPGDDEYNLLFKEESGAWMTAWMETKHLSPNESDKPLRFPGSASAPENILVVTDHSPDGPIHGLYSSPSAVEAAYPDVDELRTRIMEAVADPDEPIHIGGDLLLAFRPVQGETE
jgi:hypothetical protein